MGLCCKTTGLVLVARQRTATVNSALPTLDEPIYYTTFLRSVTTLASISRPLEFSHDTELNQHTRYRIQLVG